MSVVYICSAMVWAGKSGRTSNIESASLLFNKYLCSKYFLVSDYIAAERVHLNRLAFHVAQIQLCIHSHNIIFLYYIVHPWIPSGDLLKSATPKSRIKLSIYCVFSEWIYFELGSYNSLIISLFLLYS
jgi:hypothetical protein